MGMTSLFTAVSGLQSAQASLYTTGHNMANHSVRGFTRQYVAQTTFQYRTIGRNNTGVLQIGLGTNMSGIRQIRDKFLDMRWREAAPQLHFWEVRFSTGQELDAIFGELEGQYRMQGVLRDLNAALHELLKDPTSIESRSNFIHFAGSFLDRAEDGARAMRAYQDELNNQVKSTVQRINQLITEIDNLNRRIAREEMGGSRANDFRDWRNNAMDELSTLIDIQYRADVRTGAYNIWTDGHTLLANGHKNMLGLRFSSPGSPFVEPVFSGQLETLRYDPTGRNATALFNWERLSHEETLRPRGELFGLLVSRGLSPVNHYNSPLPSAAELRPMVYARMVMNEVLAQRTIMQNLLNQIDSEGWGGNVGNRADFEADMAALNTFAAQIREFLDPNDPRDTMPTPPTLIGNPVTNAGGPAGDFVALLTGLNAAMTSAVTAMTGGLSSDADVASVRQAGRHRFDINHGVITKTQIQFDTMIHAIVNMFNTAMTGNFDPSNPLYDLGPPQNMHGVAAVPLFTRIRDGEGWTLGNLQLNPDLLGQDGPSRLALQFDDAVSGESDTRLIAWMIEQWSSPDLIQFNDWVSMSVDTFYRNFITEMAIGTNEAGSAFRGTIEEMNTLDQRRMQISAVSLEEEMSNMIRFQHAYNASARMINTIDSMLDRIINHMGRGG